MTEDGFNKAEPIILERREAHWIEGIELRLLRPEQQNRHTHAVLYLGGGRAQKQSARKRCP